MTECAAKLLKGGGNFFLWPIYKGDKCRYLGIVEQSSQILWILFPRFIFDRMRKCWVYRQSAIQQLLV